MKHAPEKIIVRPANANDSRHIWSWRNDVGTRRNCRDEDEVGWEGHQEWFASTLESDCRQILVGVSEVTGEALGMVRFDLNPNGSEVEVSLNLSPDYRGRGLSEGLLAASIAAYVQVNVVVLSAYIKPANLPSIKCFVKCGFSLYEKNDDYHCFKNKNPVIDAIEAVRARNNVNWMDLMRLAFRVAPKEAEKIFSRVNSDDGEIAALLDKLAK